MTVPAECERLIAIAHLGNPFEISSSGEDVRFTRDGEGNDLSRLCSRPLGKENAGEFGNRVWAQCGRDLVVGPVVQGELGERSATAVRGCGG